jgi:starvation-inducible DNA-binding protein
MATTPGDVAKALDQTLTDLINLGLVSNHAQWNLVGPSFGAVTLLLQELAEVAREGGNGVAERSMSLGRHPDGRVERVAQDNPLPTLGVGPLPDTDALVKFAEIIEIVTVRLFDSISTAACDPITQGLLIGVAARIEKIAWMIRAHQAP